jgi:hypothetical protein
MKYQKILFTAVFIQILFIAKAQNTIKKENSNTFSIITTGVDVGMGQVLDIHCQQTILRLAWDLM